MLATPPIATSLQITGQRRSFINHETRIQTHTHSVDTLLGCACCDKTSPRKTPRRLILRRQTSAKELQIPNIDPDLVIFYTLLCALYLAFSFFRQTQRQRTRHFRSAALASLPRSHMRRTLGLMELTRCRSQQKPMTRNALLDEESSRSTRRTHHHGHDGDLAPNCQREIS